MSEPTEREWLEGPASRLRLDEVIEPVQKIATYLPVSDEMLAEELRKIRLVVERIDSLSQSMLKMQRLIAKNTGKLTENHEFGDADARLAEHTEEQT